MKWIKTSDLRRWASSRNCQEILPLLVRKLIRATSSSITKIKFPAGDNVMLGGWDGILEVLEETDKLPLGVSVWEFGASAKVKDKADSDYQKRTENPLNVNPKETTFIFVTPQIWTKGEDWAEEKMKEGIWKEVRVINAEILEEWIELAPSVSEWLAANHLGKPSDDVESTNWFWEKWTTGPSIIFNERLLLGGRRSDSEKLKKSLTAASMIAVKTPSREESIAFIISVFKDDSNLAEDFFARSIIVKSTDTFKQLIALDSPLILMPLFDDDGSFHYAIGKGHNLIIPLGADAPSSWENMLTLPKIERESFVGALQESGFSKEDSEKYSKESARDITILRRQLKFIQNLPEWAKPGNVQEIIPGLIVGSWDENFESDRNIIAEISGETYDEYSKKLHKWLKTPDSLFIKIGSKWRLASPLDAWSNASENISRSDFESLSKSFLKVLKEVNPSFELKPDERYMSALYGKTRVYSGLIREGLIQSLILVSIYDKQLHFDLSSNGELWVDNIISQLLDSSDPFLWKSLNYEFPLISEASPDSFISSIEKAFNLENNPIISLFEEEKGLMTPNSYHTGLLWALENLCWLPECLARASLIIAKLASIDPGGSLSNRPINSLSEIFKIWHYQTLASYDERIEVLKLIAKQQPDIAWELLISLLPKLSSSVAYPTHKMRWRVFNENMSLSYTYEEIFDTISEIVNILISLFDNTEEKLSELIEKSTALSLKEREKIFAFTESVVENMSHDNNLVWHKTRVILSNEHRHPDKKGALPEKEIDLYLNLYNKLEPKNEIQKSIWMFNEHWPSFIDAASFKNRSITDEQEKIDTRREAALQKIYAQYGIDKIIELSHDVNEKWILGDILGRFLDKKEDILRLCDEINDKTNLMFVYGFFSRRTIKEGNIQWVIELFETLKKRGSKPNILARVLVPISPSEELWNFVESKDKDVIKEYWMNISANFWSMELTSIVRGLKKLIEFKRFLSAINICYMQKNEDIPSDILIEILEKTATQENNDNFLIEPYKTNKLFEALDARENINSKKMLTLEWYYLGSLASSSSSRNPKTLYNELSTNPDFFIEVLRFTYKPDDEELIKEETQNISEKQLINLAKQGYRLIESWKQIPGVDENGEINTEALIKWIDEVREKSDKYRRLDVADGIIGKLLAQYPEGENCWPPEDICSIIESRDSSRMYDGFSTAIVNKRSFTSRGAFDGGDIERVNAEYFHKLANCHKNKFPKVSASMEKIAKRYEMDAKRMDEEAELTKLNY